LVFVSTSEGKAVWWPQTRGDLVEKWAGEEEEKEEEEEEEEAVETR
jgi:CO dehydrogenase/acetyl-CoA synthase beta subunit